MIQLNFRLHRPAWNALAAIRAAIALTAASLVFVSPSVHAQQYRILHNFNGGSDGFGPAGGLAIDATGTIYGVTQANGRTGTVYRLKPHNGSWILETLYTFTGGADGADPQTVVIGPDGALYGSTLIGGQPNCPGDGPGCGVIFRLQPPLTPCRSVSCPWTETVLYSFRPDGIDAANPTGQLTFDAVGAIYGATQYGGGDLNCYNAGCGALFKLTPSGGQWTESVLYGFQRNGAAGWLPLSGVTLDSSGNLYGTTYNGPGSLCGGYGCGTVYEVTSSGSIQTLYRFQGGTDGGQPTAGLTFDSSGNLLGTTSELGSELGGTVFQLSSSGGNWNFSLLYSFYTTGGGYGPLWNLAMDRSGNFYGTTSTDGPLQTGNVFELTRTDGGWQYTDLHIFQGGNDGAVPEGGVVVDAAGNVYGTTRFNGSHNAGVVWEITP